MPEHTFIINLFIRIFITFIGILSMYLAMCVFYRLQQCSRYVHIAPEQEKVLSMNFNLSSSLFLSFLTLNVVRMNTLYVSFMSSHFFLFQITAERNMSTEFSQKAKAYDSVSVYSNQDFSQISDCSDEEIIDMCRKLSNHGLRDNTDGKSLGLEMEQGTCGSPLEGPVEPHAEIVEKYYDAHDGISHYEKDSTSRSRSNKSDFHTTNARIHGDFQEDTKKRGIRVLQPPGGFSSGLW